MWLKNVSKRVPSRWNIFSLMGYTVASIPVLLLSASLVQSQGEFSGSLNTVSITDTTVSNTPPTAEFTYSSDGTTFSFNANTSADTDGQITEYRWKTESGSTYSGATATIPASEAEGKYITLTILDNNGAITLKSELVKSYVLAWSATSDTVEVPAGISGTRTGTGTYTSTGCVSGSCYDNANTSSSISFPLSELNSFNLANFEIILFFKVNEFIDYDYIFGLGVDDSNNHGVHIYADGRLYCRTILNGNKYYGYIADATSPLTKGQWYQLTYKYSEQNGIIEILLDGTTKFQTNTTEQIQGVPQHLTLGSDYTRKRSANIMLDELHIN